MARVAALYRSKSSTESRILVEAPAPVNEPDRARLWQAALAKSMARIKRRAANAASIVPATEHVATIVPAAHAATIVSAAAPSTLRPTPGLLIVGAR